MQAEQLFKEGQELHQKGNLKDAIYRYERALKLDPNNSKFRIFYAVILQQLGKPHDAASEAQKALNDMKKPEIMVLVNYGVILKNVGRFQDAAIAYERALEINPKLLSAKANLATIYLLQGKLDKAESIFSEIAPEMDDPGPLLNLSRILIMRGKYEEAKEKLKLVSDLDPTHQDLCLLSARLEHLDKNEKSAYDWTIKGLKKSPANRDLWVMLQVIKNDNYNLDEVEQLLIKLASSKVQSVTTLSVAVDLCRKNWIWGPLANFEKLLSEAVKVSIDKVPTPSDVFTMLGANISQVAHLEIAKKCWESLTQTTPVNLSKFVIKNPNDKIKVGFLSSDLRGHAIGYLIVGLLEHLPKEKIEWWAYSNAIEDGSEVHERVKRNFDRRVNIYKLNDIELAERIHSDGIDILIDLNQMTAMTRAAVMHHRPAPIQIQWLGMPGTLGSNKSVDYILVDNWVVNENNANGFSECILSLPRSYQPNDHVPPDLSICASREAAGLPNDGVIYGVFNQHYKFSPDTFSLWGQILREVRNSYLWLLAPKSDELKTRIVLQAKEHGIDESRLIFASHKSQNEHLARLQWMDLVLDTWPYNAHTTCSDALRAGVPVLTYPHETFASRVAYGILETAGMSEWVAFNNKDYVEKAISFGKLSRTEMDQVKSEVFKKYWSSPMVDNIGFAKTLESLLLGLYQRYIDSKPVTSLKLSNKLILEELSFGRNSETSQKLPFEDKSQFIDVNEKNKNYAGLEEESGYDWTKLIKRGEKNCRASNLQILQRKILGIQIPPFALEVAADPLQLKGQVTLASTGLINNIVIANAPQRNEENVQLTQRNQLVLGDGSIHTYYDFAFRGLSSTLKPRRDWLSLFPGFSGWTSIKKTQETKTTCLDEITADKTFRFAKMKLNGQEMMILKNSSNFLEKLALLELDMSPISMYEGESDLFELGAWLKTIGYVLHTFHHEHKSCMTPYAAEDNQQAAKHQILRLSAVFMPDPISWPSLDKDRLLNLAFLSQAIYKSSDIAMRALYVLDSRDSGSLVDSFRSYLDLASLDA